MRGVDVDADDEYPQLQRLMDRHKLSSVSFTAFYLRRIWKLNPKLNAVIELNPWAIADAHAADKARRHGVDKPLLGIPVLLKDNIDTTDMPTTAGSWRWTAASPRRLHRQATAGGRRRDHRQGEPVRVGELPLDPLVQRLERRRRPDEQPLRPGSESLWLQLRVRRRGLGEPRDGGCRHRDGRLDRLPVGRERRRRASSRRSEWLSRAGIVPISAEQDTAGPMTRNVTDAAIMLGVMTGVDKKDPATAAQVGNAFRDYTKI